ncbi:MAG: GNAT family N-acetyltransferase [Litorimonas sp.]
MRDIIETNRLVLRQTEQRDAKAISVLGSDFDIARMTGSFPYPFPLLSAEFKIMTFHAAKRRGLAHPYAITLKGEDELIGITDLFKRGPDTLWEIGYWIGRPHWGHGYMTEACIALLNEADFSLGREDRVAGVFTDNPGSARVLEKLGFKPLGEPESYFSMARLKKAPSQDFVLKAAT